MGNPSSGCGPAQSPMPLSKGSSRHRQSLSISSLPLDKFGRVNCEKRKSISAVSSPARVALTDNEKMSIATFLGHGQDFTRRKVPSGTEELTLKGIDSATGDRKTISFNPFRGHRRVGSGSFTTPCKSVSEFSQRSRSGRTSTSSSKKLDKYAVAKIAASLFQSPSKLERSMSLPRVAHKSEPEVAEKGHHSPLAMGEVILPADLEESPFLQDISQFTQSADVEDDVNKSSNSDSDLAIDKEDSASPQMSNAPSMQQENIIDITIVLECKNEVEAEQAEQPVAEIIDDPPPTTADVTSESRSPHSQVSLDAAENYVHLVDEEDSAPEEFLFSPLGPRSLCMTSTETSIQLPSTGCPPPMESQETGHESPKYIVSIVEDASGKEESKDIAVDDKFQLLLLATEEVPESGERIDTAVQCSLSSEEDDYSDDVSTDSDDESLHILSTGSSDERDMNIQVPELKSVVRKRRRSVSASGIGAMLLKVVRVSDSAQMVTRRIPKAGSPETTLIGVDALRARKYVLEKTAQISMGLAHDVPALTSSAPSTPAHACQTESEDAIKSTYSKFVDIQIDSGGHCIELVQHSKGARDGSGFAAATTFETRQRNQQATPGSSPSHQLHDHASSNCTSHKGIRNDKFDSQTKDSTFASSNTQTADEGHGGRPSKEPTSRARINTTELDYLKECLATVKTANSDNESIDQAHTTTLTSSNQVPINSRHKSRTIVSRLQAPTSEAVSRVDVYRPSSTVSILANPSFSSSHQDKLWEEQAEIYSSGGRGTPGRDDEATTANVIINLRRSPLPAYYATDSRAHHEVHPSLRSSRAGVLDSGKKRGRPKSPLTQRSLLDHDQRRRASPESGHFMQQIMSKIRGSNSPQASVHPKSRSQLAMEKRRNTWSSCICFSVK
ncbi:hypothetical protein KC19_6G191400 [Ceratodon purpureus]|uniref:Uncharacterized protein n=1 Tax=Ceratodon purpureus TaxID=3225 RepID=A0A8T0HJ79_CERPU|nr:hypothetical protein KC19_6G191400 [Ceratodon purpureus]